MITILCLTAMLLSCFCSLVLKKQEAAILLAFFAFAFIFDYNKGMSHYFYIIPSFCGFLSVVGNSAKNKALWFLLFWFAAYYCIVIFFGPYSRPIWGWMARTLSLMFLFLWVMLIKWDRKNILFIVVSYGSYLLAWGFLEKFIFNPQRVKGPMAMPTEYAIVLCIFWGIWFVDSCKQKKNFLFLILPTGLVLLAIAFSGTRIGLIGLCLGILFGIFSYTFTSSQASAMGKSVKFFAILFFTSILFLVIWNTFIKDLLIARTMESILAGKIDESNMGRIVAWICAYDTFSNNKIWGAGPETFSGIYSKFVKNIPDMKISAKSMPHAHNEILQILSEVGLLGFMHLSVIVSFCLYSIINYMRKNKNETICYGIIAGFLIFLSSMPLNGTPSFGIIPWIMGIMASYFAREKICLQK